MLKGLWGEEGKRTTCYFVMMDQNYSYEIFIFQVMKEVQSALNTAAADDSKLVLFSAVGSIFCCGLDFIYFIRRLTDDRKKESTKMAEAIRYV